MEHAQATTDARTWSTKPAFVVLALVAAVLLPLISLVIIVPGLVQAARLRHAGAVAGFGLALVLSVALGTMLLLGAFAAGPA
ncbi:MAG TPA: hypothetical protein VK501_10855 [Baekduia sp.]|uniref:hypothetical protein n=1 Tax=Baekduia sp. TaxID=2600305 RepID=UPI002CF2E6D9|nr:hypothetical protein [Baekduia sp.]HMJ34405.1 hypothetical protein [Baekduia sp.]